MADLNDMELIKTILCNAGYEVTTSKTASNPVRVSLHYRTNPDSSVRWLWPAGSKRANCLRFHTIASKKAKILATLTGQLFSFGLERLLSRGTLLLFTSQQQAEAITRHWGTDYAIFTGTAGPNRKGVIWYEKEAKGYFVKVALNDVSKKIIQKEQCSLRSLAPTRFTYLGFPEIRDSTPLSLTISDIGMSGSTRQSTFSPIHGKVLQEIYTGNISHAPINTLSQWQEARVKLNALIDSRDERLPKGLIGKLQSLFKNVDDSYRITMATAHGDFTPWNMYVSQDRLDVYDWELSLEQAPLLWDACHFIFQSGILIHRHSARQILLQTYALRKEEWVKELVRQHHLDIELALELYLLLNTIYYLDLYSKQADWHIQVEWLLETWNEAVSIVLEKKKLLSERQLLCMDIVDWLRNKRYAALKWVGGNPENLSLYSDFDICIDQKEVNGLSGYIQQHPLVKDLRENRKSFMRTFTILTNGGALLSVDAIWQFKRKTLQMMDAGPVLDNTRQIRGGVRIPSVEMDFDYTWLFYILNGASVPERYREHFLLRSETTRRQLNDHFLEHWSCLNLSHYLYALENTPALANAVLQTIKKLPANKGWSGIRNKLAYSIDSFISLFSFGGLIITFSGVDGAGKSTVIENTRLRLTKELRKKVVVLRHRPSLLPILSAWQHGKKEAEIRSASTLPRLGKNKNSFSSLLRFGYYYLDYLFGQYYILFKYVRRGYVVLYDRYYFDFINDSRRSNIQLSPRFSGWFYRLLLKPDLNFFLYARPEVILKRKQELDAATILDLTDKYLKLFCRLSKRYHRSKYIPIHNQQLENTVNMIIELVKTCA